MVTLQDNKKTMSDFLYEIAENELINAYFRDLNYHESKFVEKEIDVFSRSKSLDKQSIFYKTKMKYLQDELNKNSLEKREAMFKRLAEIRMEILHRIFSTVNLNYTLFNPIFLNKILWDDFYDQTFRIRFGIF